ncbi:MAG: bifunctional DNA-binding transcriptional regulator/O6-methylguanine-DNA methyltransferase Ada [Acidobacteriota bacterium]
MMNHMHVSTGHPPAGAGGDGRWARVLARDRSADGAFVYAVSTTGVFCRPSCPSRRPRRDHVAFFETPEAAAGAGYRPCRRCRPTEPGESLPAGIARATRYLAAHRDEAVPLAALARVAGMSRSHLQRRFTALVGVSPRQYQAACRAERFRRALRAGRDVTGAIYEAGYGSPSRVYEASPTGRGLSPGAYRAGAPGQQIGFTIVDSALGRLLVAATAKGVCAVKLGDRDGALEADLRAEFPGATLARGVHVSPDWVRRIVAMAEARVSPGAARVPLDVHGTAFQWLVWRALQRIPAGRTRTYAEVAAAIGRPTAVRAVARACATNPVSLVVPCHRVVPKKGGPGGYRWGARRKEALLARERAGK